MIPTSERLPKECVPVIGYAKRWEHADFNEKGMRECFLNGDGVWLSAAWDNDQDCWDTEEGEPDYWQYYPNRPKSAFPTGQIHEKCGGELRSLDSCSVVCLKCGEQWND